MHFGGNIVYVAKGLWRGELNYAKAMLDSTTRFDKLQPIIEWYIGVLHGWSDDAGIYGRWFHNYLDASTWESYQRTFADANIEDNWRALFETIEFVRVIGKFVAKVFGFSSGYPDETDMKVTRYIQEIREMETK